MSTIGGPRLSYVTDGLVFYVDAANPNSYVSGDTTTSSLVSDDVGVLVNDTGFSTENNGGWVLDGTDDFIYFGDTDLANPKLSSFTVNCFFKISNISNTTTNVIISKGNTGSGDVGWIIYYSHTYTSLNVRCNGNNTTSQRASQSISINEDTIYMVTLVIDRENNVILGYLNGSNDNWNNGGGGPADNDITGFDSIISPGLLKVGATSNNILDMKGNFYLSQIYNRALSSDEVLRNHNALKGRFGL